MSCQQCGKKLGIMCYKVRHAEANGQKIHKFCSRECGILWQFSKSSIDKRIAPKDQETLETIVRTYVRQYRRRQYRLYGILTFLILSGVYLWLN